MNIQTEQDGHNGALFPRVHLSETRVPGPRAPPRNKMALFEQFTIPPHRFVPPLVQENSHKVSSSIGSGLKQAKVEQLRSKASEMSCVEAKCEDVRCSVAELCFDSETSKTSVACDSAVKEYSVLHTKHANELPPGPYINKHWLQSLGESAIACNANGINSCTNIETHHSPVSQHTVLSVERETSLPYGWAGTEAGDSDKLHAFDGKATRSFLTAERSPGNDIAKTELLLGSATSNSKCGATSQENDAHIVKNPSAIETLTGDNIKECHCANNTNSLVQQMGCSGRSSEVAGSPTQQKHLISLNSGNMDRSSSDFLPSIIPKHVIGVIGQREFWEARKTMLLQQKMLSMQVFELHRVIEVQRLIAAMPGLLLGGKGKCSVVEGSTQPQFAGVSNKVVNKESLIKEAKHSAKQKQAVVKGRKQLRRLICGEGISIVNDKCQKASVQVLPSRPLHVSLDQSRVSSWDFIRTPFVRNQSLKVGPYIHGLWRAPIAFSSCPTSGQWWGGHQAMLGRPSNFPQTEIPAVCNRPLPSHQFVNGKFMDQLDPFPGPPAPWIPNGAMSVPLQSSYSTLSPSSVYEFSKPSRKPQQVARTINRKPSSDCKMTKSFGDLCLPEKATCLSLADRLETRSERIGSGFQTFRKMAPTRVDGVNLVTQPAAKEISATESCIARTNDALLFFPLENVWSSQNGDKKGVASSRVIRAVPHPASATLQAATQILKSIQQSESSDGIVC